MVRQIVAARKPAPNAIRASCYRLRSHITINAMASTLEAGDLSHYNGTAADHRYGPEGEVDASTGEYKQNVKATASESASTAALKARKRTKTGCLSE